NTNTSITYTGTTTVRNGLLQVNRTVNTQLVLQLVSGTATVVRTNGNPADTPAGDIGALFQIMSPSFTISVSIFASDADFGTGYSCPAVFDPSRANTLIRSHADISHVDLGFYWANPPIQNDGNVVCWGDNTYGQLTVPPGLSAVQVSTGL